MSIEKQKEGQLEKQMKGQVGVHLVASKLFQKKLVALTTPRNMVGYDIVVFNPYTNKGKGIQVKYTDQKEFPIINSSYKGKERGFFKHFLFTL